MALILAFLFVFTASALELDSAESDVAVLAEDYGELVFSVDFEGLTSIASGNAVAKTSADFGSSNVIVYNGGMSMVYGLGKPVSSGSQMFSMATNAYHGCVRFQGFTLNKPGTYTVTYDRYYTKAVAYQSCGMGVAPDTTNVVHAATSIQNVTASRTLAAGESMSYINLQFAAYQAGKTDCPLYIDNVKLYYKAPEKKVNVNIMAGEEELYETVTINAGSAVTLPTASDFAEYTPDGKFLKGFMAGEKTVAPGASYTVTADDAETGTFDIYPVFVSIPEAGYGELVFFEDFEALDGAIDSGDYLDTLMMGTFAGKKVQLYNRNAGSSYAVEAPDGCDSKMLKISGGNYPQVALFNLGLNKAGTYVVMFDYYLADSTTISFIQAGFNNSVARFGEIVKGEATPTFLTKTLSDGETINSIDFQTGFTNPAIYIDNIRIYYNASAAPVALKANSMRTTGATGVRFISFANYAVRSFAEEYGYIVAADDGETDYSTALVFADGERTEGVVATNANGVKYLYAANYIRNTKDVVYSETGDFLPASISMGDDGVYFTAVMTNIPATSYNRKLYVRPYAVIGGKIYYGNVVSKSLYEAAKDMKNSAGYTENAFVENIINTVENA